METTKKMDLRNCTVKAKYIYKDGEMKENLQMQIDNTGKIVKISEKLSDHPIDMGERAIIPGLISSHSHAFHRGLRGRSHIGDADSDTFWGWRDDMYAYVNGMDADKFYQVCYDTFTEMRWAGITTVGEFHYFHHSQPRDVDDANCNNNVALFDFDKIILNAAANAGIRICLLLTYYERSGMSNAPLACAQKRFYCAGQQEFWHNFDQLASQLTSDGTQTLGVACHSVRAVSVENAVRLREEALRRKLPYHMHMEEQPAEITYCQQYNGMTPSQIAIEKLKADETFTGVHLSYTNDQDLSQFLCTLANLSICPLTEGYLGDGIPSLCNVSTQSIKYAQEQISIGTDCNNRLCMIEEMRWLMYGQQLKTNKRGASCFLNGAQSLLKVATQNGARALLLDDVCGQLKEGFNCDFVTLNLNSSIFKNCAKDALVDALVFGGSSDSAIDANCVAGKIIAKFQL